MTRKNRDEFSRTLLVFVLAACIVPILFAFMSSSDNHDSVTEEELRTEETTTTTTEIVTTTTTTTATTTTESTSSYTTTSLTTTSVTTTVTEKLMTYEILQRIDVINVLLDNSNYDRLVKKDPEKLTSDERVELYYYSGLVLERKQLKEYLEKHK